jgi:hypothetical protein
MTVLAYEIHSELAVVCPDVRREALPILATEHEAHLARYQCDAANVPAPVTSTSCGEERSNIVGAIELVRPPFILALAAYALRAVATTALTNAVFIAAFCALALILTLLA